MEKLTALSFIIPAFNEAGSIGRTIEDIKKNVPEKISYQVIVVDNGSTDDTVGIAELRGAKVFVDASANISRLRNIGAENCDGEVLVFIDADISLTEDWSRSIESAYRQVLKEPLLMGSKCLPVGDEGIIDSCWFRKISQDTKTTYLGTGHLLVSNHNFKKIGGFNERLATGEDYEFCRQAKLFGMGICLIPELSVIHHGFPKTLVAFMKREAWHGAGDLLNLYTFFSSKVAITASIYLFLHVFLIFIVIHGSYSTIIFSLALILIIPISVSFYKFKNLRLMDRLNNIILSSAYLYGRSASPLFRKRRWR